MLANIPAGILLRWWRPRPYLWAVSLLLVVVTGLTGLAPTSEWLIAARVLARVLGGAAITIGFAILVAGAPPARRGRVMATVTAVQMSAGAIGSFLGGLVLTWFPLEVVFLVAGVPLALMLAWDAVRPAAHYCPAAAPWRPRLQHRRQSRQCPTRWSSLSRPHDPIPPRWMRRSSLSRPHDPIPPRWMRRSSLSRPREPAHRCRAWARPATPAWGSPPSSSPWR
ncbi:MFS transporter [Cryobacterium sp. 1639]|nr:MFS transporter [Cryobacterium sp. 1639]